MAFRQIGQPLDSRIQRQLTSEGFGELPSAFDPTQFRRQVETARGEIAAPSLRALESRARQAQLAGRFTSPAVQAASQQQVLEGFGAGRGEILAGAGQAALGRELPIQRLQQQSRQEQLGRIQDIQAGRRDQQQQRSSDRLRDLQIDLLRQQRLEGTMESASQRARDFMDRSRQRDIQRRAEQRAGTLTGERAIRGGSRVGSNLSTTASNIIRAFGPSAGRR